MKACGLEVPATLCPRVEFGQAPCTRFAGDQAGIPPLERYIETGEAPDTEDVTEEPVAG